MKYLVTGGAGFIGSMLSKTIVKNGDELVIVDCFKNSKKNNIKNIINKITLYTVDIRETAKITKIFTEYKPDAVCHLAAIHFIPYCNKHPIEALDINVIGTQSVIEACRVATPKMLVIASTAAVYGISEHTCNENERPDPIDIYGVSKYSDELLAKIYSAQTNAPSIAARIFNAVGPNETNPHVVPQLIDQLKKGKREIELGNLEPSRDYIDTTDLANGLIKLMNHKQNGFDQFNLGTGKQFSVRKLVEMCETITRSSIKIKQRKELMRKVERMYLCANIEKTSNIVKWKAKISLENTLKSLLL